MPVGYGIFDVVHVMGRRMSFRCMHYLYWRCDASGSGGGITTIEMHYLYWRCDASGDSGGIRPTIYNGEKAVSTVEAVATVDAAVGEVILAW